MNRVDVQSHLGRVKEEADKEGKSQPHQLRRQLLSGTGLGSQKVTRGAEWKQLLTCEDGQVLLVENTRFEDVDGKKV